MICYCPMRLSKNSRWYHMSYSQLAQQLVKNRIYKINFDYSAFHTKGYIRVHEELSNIVERFSETYTGHIARADIYECLLEDLEKTIDKYGLVSDFYICDDVLNIVVKFIWR